MSTLARTLFELISAAFLFVISVDAPSARAAEPADAGDAVGEVVMVSTAAELMAALVPGNAQRRIRVLRGDYAVDRPLAVPDGVVLEGEGVMRLQDGLPVGFEPGTASTVRAATGFAGDLLTLGNGAVLRGLRLEGYTSEPGAAPQQAGNVVAVLSRAAGDAVAAIIIDCELFNPNPPEVGPEGPIGHALVALTRNPRRHLAPAPDTGATVSVRLERSVVRSNGSALFAINFAAGGSVNLALEGNRLEGPLSAAGGASRPDDVSRASVSVESRNNLYALHPGGFDAFGWRLIGGSSSHLPELGAPGANHNLVRVRSVNDRIEGFKVGIQASGGRRWLGSSDPVSDNRVELELHGTRILSEGQGAADWALHGALSEEAPEVGREFPPGDRNVVRVLMRGVSGSPSPRPNLYADVFGPALDANRGSGNRLEFAGSREEFARSNPNITAAPPAEYFRD